MEDYKTVLDENLEKELINKVNSEYQLNRINTIPVPRSTNRISLFYLNILLFLLQNSSFTENL